jgi:hypothetical protein
MIYSDVLTVSRYIDMTLENKRHLHGLSVSRMSLGEKSRKSADTNL